MFRSTIRRSGAVSTLAAVALALAMAPVVSADTSVSETGTTGMHRLRDTSRNPGVTCKYNTTFSGHGGWAGDLVRLIVRPPKVWAASGTQKVGWRFMAQRKRGSGSWLTTYTSGTSKKNATTSTMAAFSQKSINVNLPADHGDRTYRYRVMVEMFWYNAAGSTTGSSVHRVNYYKRNYDGGVFTSRKGICEDGESVGP